MSIFTTSVVHVSAANPTIYIDPAAKTVKVGEQFTVNISLDYAEKLYGYEVWLSFDKNKLNATAIEYKGFLNTPIMVWYKLVNNTGGYVALAVSSLHPAEAKTGGSPPPLATVHFKCIGVGKSPLRLFKTILSDNQARAIPHTVLDGELNCVPHEPKILIMPAITFVRVNEEFNVTVALDYAENLYGFEFWLSFDKTKLYAKAIHYTGYLNEPSIIWYKRINNTAGYLTLAVSSLHPATGKTGGGNLAILNFRSISTGTSALRLYKTYLVNDKGKAIAHTAINGTVHVVTGVLHDIAVTKVKLLKTVVGQGYATNISVTVENQGACPETFNVSLYASRPDVGIVNIKLFGSTARGWGFTRDGMTIPGPPITVKKGDIVNLTLTSVDARIHNFFVDYNGNTYRDLDEPISPDFPAPPYYMPTITFKFKAERVGTFKYYSSYDKTTMYGDFIVEEPTVRTTEISKKEITLNGGSSAILTFTWNTNDFAKGNYTIWAYAWPVPDEIDVADNTLVGGWVFVSIPGDVILEFRLVDIYDVTALCAAYEAKRGFDGYYWHEHVCNQCPHSSNFDINDDGIIDIFDVVICTSRYEQAW
ncbi:MAG: cohesin domain-containing protein [Candidatus Bathyarchaeota archaeon]|nr:cohesin domain-containing protein [Candidatus Bathyarchaeota archaeon]MDW8022588.1 cohesin domain-containing protein [Nitrososphaerota archaeon]